MSLNNRLKNKTECLNCNLKHHKKLPLVMIQSKINLIQNNSSTDTNKEEGSHYIKLVDIREKRLIRVVWVIVIVVIFSFYCFIFMKSAIDCANNSKNAINKLKESQAKDIQSKLQRNNLIGSGLGEVSE